VLQNHHLEMVHETLLPGKGLGGIATALVLLCSSLLDILAVSLDSLMFLAL